MSLRRYRVYTGRETIFSREQELAKHVGGNDFGQRKVEAQIAIVPDGRAFDQLVVSAPVAVGVSVTDVLSGERAVFVAEHGNLCIDGSRMREEVGGGETLWRGVRRGYGEQERSGGAKREKGIARRREGDDSSRVVTGEGGDETVWTRERGPVGRGETHLG